MIGLGALVAFVGAASTAGATTVPGGSEPTASEPMGSAPTDSAAPASEPMGSAPTDSAAPAEPTAIAVTLTETSIDGLPDDLVAGLVDVTVTDETEAAGGEVNFSMVEPGTDAATFVEGLTALFEGGPFPDFFLNNAGAVGHTMTTLDDGEYIVWIDLRPTSTDRRRPRTSSPCR